MPFGGFDSGNQPQPMAEINTTPLVDVMLVLLVVFMITAPLLTHALRIDVPAAQAPVSAEEPETIRIAIDAAGALYWGDERLDDIATLDARLARAATSRPQPVLHLRADRSTRYERIAEVMAGAQRAGIERIGFVTDPQRTGQRTPGANARGESRDSGE